MEIRNIAIIAHVDHGKTTLTDALLRQAGVAKEGTSMDSNKLEQERKITIYSKNAALYFNGTKINVVDTPGHADFGSEVERVLRSIDSVLLVVDAQEGPMPQTRFVLKKSLELGLKPIVVINKIDKPAADPARCHDLVLDLFLELGASDEQAYFPVVYARGREGIAKKNLTDESYDLTPLLETICEHVKPASSPELSAMPLRLQPFNLGYDNFMGRLAVARVYEGTVAVGQNVFVKKPTRLAEASGVARDGEMRTGKITKLFTFNGLERIEQKKVEAGDIVLVAGLPDIDIGETVAGNAEAEPLPAIAVDEPTITLNVLVNNSPFAGQEGEYVTSRKIREFLEKESEVNVGLKVDYQGSERKESLLSFPSERRSKKGCVPYFDSSLNASLLEALGDRTVSQPALADFFRVSGRGELHVAILLENMRRNGFEVQVSQPQVIIREEAGKKLEPFEEVVVDTPVEFQGTVIERLGMRGFVMKDLSHHGETVRLIFEGPTRGLLGYRNQFVVDTKGEGILSSRFLEFRPYVGEIKKRATGSMASMATGKALGFALWNLQERGTLYIGPATEVYEGMVIGNTTNGVEMAVNPTKGKQLTNIRAAASDEAINLVPFQALTIEKGLEVMAGDEYLEITPKNVRLRKKYLSAEERSKHKGKG